MRSVSVVFPLSMWAEMPMFRMLDVGDESLLPAADFDGIASAAAGIEARPRACRSKEKGRVVFQELGEEVDWLASGDDRKRSGEVGEGAAATEASIVDDELALLPLLLLLHLRAAANAALAAEERMIFVLLLLSSSSRKKERRTKTEREL